MKPRKIRHENVPKYVLLIALGIALSVGAIMAQGFAGSSRLIKYDLRKPPPLALPQAYELAVGELGDVTNRFHCVSATCLNGTNRWSTTWVFTFSNTNGDHADVKVHFIGTVRIDPESAALLK